MNALVCVNFIKCRIQLVIIPVCIRSSAMLLLTAQLLRIIFDRERRKVVGEENYNLANPKGFLHVPRPRGWVGWFGSSLAVSLLIELELREKKKRYSVCLRSSM